LGIDVKEYQAEWAKYGIAAGPIRNKKMLVEGKPDIVLAFHNNITMSKGTKNMIKVANAMGVLVNLYHSNGRIEFNTVITK